MATIFGLNAAGSGGGIMDYAKKTPAQIAAAAQTKAVTDKVKTLTAITVDEKPAALAPGEVVKLTNDKGKVEYYVGTATGGLSKPLTSVSSAVTAVNNTIKEVEKAQSVALRSTQKIELSELEQSLEAQGLKSTEIKPILAAEKAANTAEVKQLTGLLGQPNLQYATRAADNTFVNNVVDGKLTPSALPTSLLNYNDPVYSAPATQAIQQANDAVAEFKLLHGFTQPFLGKGNEQSGVDSFHIYQALDGNHIQTVRDPVTGAVTDYKFSDEVLKAKGEQSGLMNAIDGGGFGKYEARLLGQILGPDTLINEKANVVTDGSGNYFVNDKSGADRYGKQNALVDTGRVVDSGKKDANGNPIMNKVFAEVATDNSKRNYVSVVTNYVQQPDGSFTYGGIDSTNYTHVEGFDPIKSLVIAGMSAGAGLATGPLTGLTGAIGNATAGAVAGGLGAALSGSNILKGALLGGLGGFGVGEIQAAAKAAGGYTNLFNQVGTGNFSAFSGPANAGIKLGLDSAGNIIDTATGKAFTGTGIPNLNVNTVLGNGGAGVNLLTGAGNVIGSQVLGNLAGGGTLGDLIATSGNASGVTAGDVLGANMGDVDTIANQVDLNPITNVPGGSPGINLSVNANGQIVDLATGLPFSPPGINLTLDAAGNIIDATTGLPFTGPGINVVNPTTGTYVNPVTQIPFLPDPNTSTITTPGGTPDGTTGGTPNPVGPTSPYPGYVTPLVVTGGLLAADKLVDALKPNPPATTTYTAPLLTPGQAPLTQVPLTQVPNFTQNYNNLFNRQGVGAGQFLGYDYLNNINVPPELMGLLGTSAQARPTSFTMPSMTTTPA